MTQPEDVIVGKSVEEIEAESGNRVNSPVSGEDHRDVLDTALLPAASGPMSGGQAGAGLVGLPGIFGTEVRGLDSAAGEDAVNTRRDTDLDASEEE